MIAKYKLIGLSIGIILIIVSVVMIRLSERQASLSEATVIASPPAKTPIDIATYKDIQALRAEVEHLIVGRHELDQRIVELNHTLEALQTQLTSINQNQVALTQHVNQVSKISGMGIPTTINKEEPLDLEQTPEEAESQQHAYLELMEETIRAEQTDPRWAPSAQSALNEMFQDKTVQGRDLQGLDVINIECHTTMCRLELVRNGFASPEQDPLDSIRLIPWQGPELFHIDSQSGKAIAYLVREGYDLPQKPR